MANSVFIFSEEFVARIRIGLGEIATKFGGPVLADIETQLKLAESGGKEYVDAIDNHISAIKSKVEAIEAKAKAAAEGIAAEAKQFIEKAL